MACTAAGLAALAASYDGLSEREHLIIQTYLLATTAQGSVTAATLLATAISNGFDKLSEKELLMIQAERLCVIANGGP